MAKATDKPEETAASNAPPASIPPAEKPATKSTDKPEETAAAAPKPSSRKQYQVRRVNSGTEFATIVADCVEDAIRDFNNNRTSFSRKQLEIVEG